MNEPELHDYPQIVRAYQRGDRTGAIEQLDQLIDRANSRGGVPPDAVYALVRIRDTWRRAELPDYQPPSRVEYSLFAPLLIQAKDLAARGLLQESLELSYQFLTYCSVGTAPFGQGVAFALENAAAQGNWRLARSMAMLFLGNYLLGDDTSLWCAIVTDSAKDRRTGKGDPDHMQFLIPIRGALRGITEDPAQVWVDVIELAIRDYPFRFPVFHDALTALGEYYLARSDHANAERVLHAARNEPRWEPDSSEE